MSGLWVLLLLIFISAIPVIAIYCYLRIIHYPLSLTRFLIILLAGAAAFFPALFLQNIIPESLVCGKWASFFQIFVRIALTEELSRFLVLIVLFGIGRGMMDTVFQSADAAPLSYSAVNMGTTAGLIAGLGFALLESAVYGASDISNALLRSFTAAPLHAACGSRVGASVILFRKSPVQAVFRFCSAVVVHGIYDFMIAIPGFSAIAAVLIALSALASSILSIHSGRNRGSTNEYEKSL